MTYALSIVFFKGFFVNMLCRNSTANLLDVNNSSSLDDGLERLLCNGSSLKPMETKNEQKKLQKSFAKESLLKRLHEQEQEGVCNDKWESSSALTKFNMTEAGHDTFVMLGSPGRYYSIGWLGGSSVRYWWCGSIVNKSFYPFLCSNEWLNLLEEFIW